MKKLTLAAAMLASFTAMTSAHAYQTEVGATYNYDDPDHAKSTNNFGVDGTYYFNPVPDNNAPLAEAAFMNRASNVNAAVNYGDNSGVKNTNYGAGVEVFIPNTDFYVAGDVARHDYEIDDYKTHLTNYKGQVGYLPAPNLLVALGVVGTSIKNGDDDTDPFVRAKYVTRAGSNDINLEAQAGFGDSKYIDVGGDYYIDNTFSLGANYERHKDALDTTVDTWGLRAKKFFTQQVSVEGRVGFGDDDTSVGIRGAYRF